MNNWQSYIFSDGEGKRADITKIPRSGRVTVYKLTVCGYGMTVQFMKSYPTYKQAREALNGISAGFTRIA